MKPSFPEAEYKEFEPQFKFKSRLNWNRFLGNLSRGLNSLNSDTGYRAVSIVGKSLKITLKTSLNRLFALCII